MSLVIEIYIFTFAAISNNRGSRCCKRSTMTVLEVATEYFREVLGVEFGHVPAAWLRCEGNMDGSCSKR